MISWFGVQQVPQPSLGDQDLLRALDRLPEQLVELRRSQVGDVSPHFR